MAAGARRVRTAVWRRSAIHAAFALALVVGACDTDAPATQPDDGHPATASSEAEEPEEPEGSPIPTVTVAPTSVAADPTEADTDTFEWPTGPPSALGFDVEILRAGLDALESQDSNAHSLVVIRDGAVVIDAALWPSSAGQPHDLASVTKSVVSLVVGAAIERGEIESLDTPLAELVELPADAAVAHVTIRDLLGMRAGLDCSADDGEFELKEMSQSPDFVAFSSELPAVGVPGETFAYCSPGYHLISAAITNATGRRLSDYAAETLFEPLGVEEWDWPSDSQGVTHGWGDLALRPLDLARLGQLMIQDGRWGHRQVLPVGYVAGLAAAIPTTDPTVRYGLGWWLPTDAAAGALEGIGRGGQELLVWPEQELVVVVTGAEADGSLIAHTVAAALLPEPMDDPDADAEIARRFAALSLPPTPRAPSLPGQEIAMGQWFDLDSNALGVERVRVDHADEHTTIGIGIGDEVFELPVGLDGVARTTSNSPTGGSVALVGDWADAVLTVDYEDVFGPDHWTFWFDLGSTFTMTVTDVAAVFPPMVIPGSLAPE